jgi:hypothetical protein
MSEAFARLGQTETHLVCTLSASSPSIALPAPILSAARGATVASIVVICATAAFILTFLARIDDLLDP